MLNRKKKMMDRMMIYQGDCRDIMKNNIGENTIDSMVTDPPAGISFMNKHWDSDKGGRDNWIKDMEIIYRECYRVLKPGAHGFVWALPRTSHWTTMALENAGFEIRDIVTHVFGSGFPKSYNISKGIDKKFGCERMVVGVKAGDRYKYEFIDNSGKIVNTRDADKNIKRKDIGDITTPTHPKAIEFDGWGTALKPASEHWILIRKPISEKNIVENVLRWGVGGINIDECRIEANDLKEHSLVDFRKSHLGLNYENDIRVELDDRKYVPNNSGRFPANFIHDGSSEVVEQFPDVKSTKFIEKGWSTENSNDSGSASRFFYCSKPSKKEKNDGLDDMPEQIIKGRDPNQDMLNTPFKNRTSPRKNMHPTVKPIKLMKYLITMITPKGGTVLDPFMGSGTTGVASQPDWNFIGIEMEKEYFEIAEKRITSISDQSK